MTAPEVTYVDCPACHGKGAIELDDPTDRFGLQCGTCWGDGFIEVVES